MISGKSSLLLVEDDSVLGETLKDYLCHKGFHCSLATNAKEAEELFFKGEDLPSIVLMDIGLPDKSGLELAEKWLGIRSDFALLFLSAQQDPEIRLK